jgi:hypothetical protein
MLLIFVGVYYGNIPAEGGRLKMLDMKNWIVVNHSKTMQLLSEN